MAEGDRSWHQALPKLVAVVGTTVAAAIGITQLVDKFIIDPPPTASVEYIVDVSDKMSGKIEGRPKLPAVSDEIVSDLRNTPSLSTALRLAGDDDECDKGADEPDVGFSDDNADEIEEALRREPRGKSDFATAVRHAVDDFIGPKKGADGKTTTVYIYVAGGDDCSPRPVEDVKDALSNLRAKTDVRLNLKLYGVKPSRKLKGTLQAIGRAAKKEGYGARIQFVKKASDLQQRGSPVSAGASDPP